MTLHMKEAKDFSVLRYYFVQIGVCHLHHQTVQIQWTTLKSGAARSPNCWYISTNLQGTTSQGIRSFNSTTVRMSNLRTEVPYSK